MVVSSLIRTFGLKIMSVTRLKLFWTMHLLSIFGFGCPLFGLTNVRLDTARINTARIDTARINTARIDTARIKTARIKTAPNSVAQLDRAQDDSSISEKPLTIVDPVKHQVAPLEAGLVLGDRLVVTIGSQPYTQRHVEAYTLLKAGLRPGVPITVGPSTWKDILAAFTADMQLKVDDASVVLSESQWAALAARVDSKQGSHPDYGRQFSRLHLSTAERRKLLAEIVTINNIKNADQAPTSPERSTANLVFPLPGSQAELSSKLQDRTQEIPIVESRGVVAAHIAAIESASTVMYSEDALVYKTLRINH